MSIFDRLISFVTITDNPTMRQNAMTFLYGLALVVLLGFGIQAVARWLCPSGTVANVITGGGVLLGIAIFIPALLGQPIFIEFAVAVIFFVTDDQKDTLAPAFIITFGALLMFLYYANNQTELPVIVAQLAVAAVVRVGLKVVTASPPAMLMAGTGLFVVLVVNINLFMEIVKEVVTGLS